MKRKKKDNPQITFMLIPHNAGRPYRFQLSRKVLSGMAIGLGLVITLFIVVSMLFYSSQEEIRQVESIKQENREKEQAIQLLGEEIEKIEEKQDAIAQKQDQLKRLMGIQSEGADVPIPSRGGQGGIDREKASGANGKALQQAETISMGLVRQEKELDGLLAQVNNNIEYFRHLPNQWPAEGEITSGFGWRESPFGGSSSTFHEGLDIANASGQPIVAAGDGSVIFAGWQGAYGKLVEIDHGYGYVTKYGHNSALLVEVGDQVKKGELIAKLGNTGRSTGPHLHFMVVKDGENHDPMIYLP